jgi:hypothetical protein
VFLREHRYGLFDESFQQEFAAMRSDTPYGTAAKPPVRLAIVTPLKAYQQASDAAAVENT